MNRKIRALIPHMCFLLVISIWLSLSGMENSDPNAWMDGQDFTFKQQIKANMARNARIESRTIAFYNAHYATQTQQHTNALLLQGAYDNNLAAVQVALSQGADPAYLGQPTRATTSKISTTKVPSIATSFVGSVIPSEPTVMGPLNTILSVLSYVPIVNNVLPDPIETGLSKNAADYADNIRCSNLYFSSLYFAAYHGNIAMTEILIQSGSPIHRGVVASQTNQNDTVLSTQDAQITSSPLHAVMHGGHGSLSDNRVAVIRLLTDAGGRLDFQDWADKRPIDYLKYHDAIGLNYKHTLEGLCRRQLIQKYSWYGLYIAGLIVGGYGLYKKSALLHDSSKSSCKKRRKVDTSALQELLKHESTNGQEKEGAIL